MKKLLSSLILIAFGALSAQAATLHCSNANGWRTQGMYVTADVKGEYFVTGENSATFGRVSFVYQIYWDQSLAADALWSTGGQVYNDLANEPNYSPRKYKDHLKFAVWVSGNPNSGYGYGDLDLIVPAKELLEARSGSEFTGYLMMTYMDDHYGGTVRLSCSIL